MYIYIHIYIWIVGDSNHIQIVLSLRLFVYTHIYKYIHIYIYISDSLSLYIYIYVYESIAVQCYIYTSWFNAIDCSFLCLNHHDHNAQLVYHFRVYTLLPCLPQSSFTMMTYIASLAFLLLSLDSAAAGKRGLFVPLCLAFLLAVLAVLAVLACLPAVVLDDNANRVRIRRWIATRSVGSENRSRHVCDSARQWLKNIHTKIPLQCGLNIPQLFVGSGGLNGTLVVNWSTFFSRRCLWTWRGCVPSYRSGV